MKTLGAVKKEIEDIKSEIKTLSKSDDKKDVSKCKKLRNRLPALRQYSLYLETNPTKEFCDKEINRMSNRINEILKLYIPPEQPERFTKSQLSKMKKEFEKKWELPKLRKQISAILYILR